MNLFYCWTRPWHECEHCIIGFGYLKQDDWTAISFCLFFVEIGLEIRHAEAKS